MLVVDLNVLLYATDEASVHHDTSREWLDGALNRPGSLGLTWLVMVGFVRLATHPKVWRDPLDPEQALDEVQRWVAAPGSNILEPSARHLMILRGLLGATGTAANLTNDAHLAAIALEHGVRVCSYDTDFDRFPGVDRVEPS